MTTPITDYTELEKLRANFAEVQGHPFQFFYCPALWVDEDTELCMGHIVNKGFPDSPLDEVVQRKDVDGWYGSVIEAEYLAMRHFSRKDPLNALVDKEISRSLKPKILLNDKPIEYFWAAGNVPAQFTPLNILSNGKVVKLGLKLPPEHALAAANQQWDISVEKDLRVPALVSLIKSAHLTLFSILGYHYGRSATGNFVGRSILGEFYLKNHRKRKDRVLETAVSFFRPYAHMLRPIEATTVELKGTITDKTMLICQVGRAKPWAIIVFIRVMQSLHAVIVPAMEDVEGAARYHEFLTDQTEQIATKWVRFQDSHWEIEPDVHVISWPKTGTLMP